MNVAIVRGYRRLSGLQSRESPPPKRGRERGESERERRQKSSGDNIITYCLLIDLGVKSAEWD